MQSQGFYWKFFKVNVDISRIVSFIVFDLHLAPFPSSLMHNININSQMPHLDLQWMEEICIKPLLACVPFAYVKTVSKGLSIMHETLLGSVYCNTLFLPVTIHAQVCIILWDMPVLNYSVTHLFHRIPFNKHEHIHILKDSFFFFYKDTTTTPQSVPLERWKSYYLAVRTCRTPTPMLGSLCKKGIPHPPPVHLETACSVFF